MLFGNGEHRHRLFFFASSLAFLCEDWNESLSGSFLIPFRLIFFAIILVENRNKLTMNLCSKCYRECHQEEDAVAKITEKQAAVIASNSAVPVEQREVVKIVEEPEVIEAKVVVSNDDAGDAGPPPRKVQKNRNRCWCCQKKVGLLGFECRCGYVFCTMHRHADQHECDFDYKAFDRENLSKANPVVMAEKVDKI